MAAADGDVTHPCGGGLSTSTEGHDCEGVDEYY
jgi:hypothetical protein